MRKKLIYSLVIVAICSTGFACLYTVNSFTSSLNTETPCAFCDHQIVSRQKFYEDDVVIAKRTTRCHREDENDRILLQTVGTKNGVSGKKLIFSIEFPSLAREKE